MLNYILPPIIIVISVSILIMFLFRKADQIPAGEFIADENKREKEKKSTKIMSVISQFGLRVLERLMHHSKLLSLKFHNVSNAWFQTIREKRKRNIEMQKEINEQSISSKHPTENENDQQITQEAALQPADIFAQKKSEPRPMVREFVAMPQKANKKEKNQLEEVLIKRIAINPKDIEAYERLGDYYLESENFQDSLECFKQVLLLSPSHHKAKSRIRRLERMK